MAKNIIARDFELADPLQEDFDIKIVNGDFHISNDSNQELADSIYRAFSGEYRINPSLGIGIATTINGSRSRLEIETLVKNGLALDNFDTTDVRVTINQDILEIKTNADRKR